MIYGAPGMKSKRLKGVFIGLMILAALFSVVFIRAYNIRFQSGDMTTFLKWYDYIVEHGQLKAFSDSFFDYTPAYLYLISFISLFAWIPKLIGIKLIAFIFEISAAVAAYKIILQQTNKKDLAIFSLFMVLLLPTVFIESGIWGQCDIIYTSFLLWMLFALLKGRNTLALIFFSIAFAFKIQAVFVAPLFVLLLLRKKSSGTLFFFSL